MGPRTTLEQMYAAFRRRDWSALAARVHPEAELRTFLAPHRVLRGRDEWRTALEDAIGHGVYEFTVSTFEDLGGGYFLGTGSVRYGRSGSISHQTTAWVFTFDDGMVKTSETFPNEGAARNSVSEGV